jgi:23S rRNA (uracil1939-C5)-methyltransferase
MANGAHGIAKDPEQGTVFIENACPGDELEAEIYDQRKGFAFASITDLTQASDLRETDAPCKIHKICGSCQWQHIKYDEQLNFKKQNLLDLMQQNNIETSFEIPNLIGMSKPWNYRNKVIYPVEIVQETGRVKAGYFRRNSNELINIKYCPIQYTLFDEVMMGLKELMDTRGYPNKLIRHIMLRSNSDNTELLISMIVRKEKLNKEFKNKIKSDLRKIQEEYKQIKTTSINYNDLSTNVILGDETEIISGEGFITESLGDIKLELSSTSFFQVNTEQFLKVIDLIKKHIKPGDRILDLYCGIGTISLSLAKSIPDLKLHGVEVVAAAIVNAKRNAELNGIANTEFIEAKVEDWDEIPEHDAVIVNPPRKGCTNKVLDKLAETPKVIYVSCNPATLTRDIKYLEQFGFKLSYLQPVDMFPHSFHFENLAVLER